MQIVDVSDSRSYYRDLIKQYGHSKNCGNQTSLVASTSSTKKDSNQAVIDKYKDASNAKGETVEVSSQKSATKNSVLPIPARRDNVTLTEWNLKT